MNEIHPRPRPTRRDRMLTAPDRDALRARIAEEIARQGVYPVARRTLALLAEAALEPLPDPPGYRVVDRAGAPRLVTGDDGRTVPMDLAALFDGLRDRHPTLFLPPPPEPDPVPEPAGRADRGFQGGDRAASSERNRSWPGPSCPARPRAGAPSPTTASRSPGRLALRPRHAGALHAGRRLSRRAEPIRDRRRPPARRHAQRHRLRPQAGSPTPPRACARSPATATFCAMPSPAVSCPWGSAPSLSSRWWRS